MYNTSVGALLSKVRTVSRAFFRAYNRSYSPLLQPPQIFLLAAGVSNSNKIVFLSILVKQRKLNLKKPRGLKLFYFHKK